MRTKQQPALAHVKEIDPQEDCNLSSFWLRLAVYADRDTVHDAARTAVGPADIAAKAKPFLDGDQRVQALKDALERFEEAGRLDRQLQREEERLNLERQTHLDQRTPSEASLRKAQELGNQLEDLHQRRQAIQLSLTDLHSQVQAAVANVKNAVETAVWDTSDALRREYTQEGRQLWRKIELALEPAAQLFGRWCLLVAMKRQVEKDRGEAETLFRRQLGIPNEVPAPTEQVLSFPAVTSNVSDRRGA